MSAMRMCWLGWIAHIVGRAKSTQSLYTDTLWSLQNTLSATLFFIVVYLRILRRTLQRFDKTHSFKLISLFCTKMQGDFTNIRIFPPRYSERVFQHKIKFYRIRLLVRLLCTKMFTFNCNMQEFLIRKYF